MIYFRIDTVALHHMWDLDLVQFDEIFDIH